MKIVRALSLFSIPLLAALLLPPPSRAAPPLRVGVALPLTGVGADYAAAYRNGMEMALDEKPERRDRLEFIFDDHQYDSKLSLSVVRKLDSINKVDVTYVWGFTPSDTVGPIAGSLRAPLLLATINPVGRGRAKVVNIESPLSVLMAPLAAHVREANLGKIAFVATQLGALEPGAAAVKDSLPAASVTGSDSVVLDNTDFKTIITRLRGNGVRAVGLFLAPEQMKLFIEQARALRFEPAYFGGNTFNDKNVTQLFSDTDEGPVFVDSFLDPEFARAYEVKFKHSSHVTEAARSHFLVGLLDFAARTAKDRSPAAIIEAVRSFPPGSGPAGSYKIVEDAHFGRYVAFEPQLYRIARGKAVRLSK